MTLCSTHTRLTRTSSDLRLLSAVLLPPSPILKADDFPASTTTGEIPILLEATTHVCASACDGELILGLYNVAEESKLTPRRDKAMHIKNWMYEELDNTCTTAELSDGRYRNAESPGDSGCPIRAICGKMKNGVVSTSHDCLFGANVRWSSTLVLGGRCEPLRLLGKQGDVEGLRDSQASRSSIMEPNNTTIAPEEDPDGDQLVTSATFHTYSMLPTPTFAPPSPSSSADVISPLSSPISRQRHRRPLERARAVRFPGRPRSPRMQHDEHEADPAHKAPPSPTIHASHPRRWVSDPVPTVSTRSCAADCDTHVPDVAHPFARHVALPEELSWIKHMTIQLWIDQEGFRSVRPCMQLIGYSPRSRSFSNPYESAENARPDVTAGVAEFMPTKRETFVFHYATLDSPPTLRMVSVAGDESRDYISRQATLSVKANGVYTVVGTEAFVASTVNHDVHGSRLQNVRIRWKFDYLVSDRKADGTGKILSGEKTLTPLTFSCSPYLFHQSQGKKTGLMHVMKKNLALRLASQKLEPPSYTPNHGSLPQASPCYLSPGAVTHARSRSDASSAGRYPATRSAPDAGVKVGTMQGVDYAVPRARRRRASSAGENSLTCHGVPRLKEGMLLSSPTLLR